MGDQLIQAYRSGKAFNRASNWFYGPRLRQVRESVVAVIATYRPEATALLGLIGDLERDGVMILVVDDASPCTFDQTLRLVADRGIELILSLIHI